jgi:probable rRNA maturation factor
LFFLYPIFVKKSLIQFNHDKFLPFAETDLAPWLNNIAQQEGYAVAQLEYNFVGADIMLSLNQEYLNHDTDTDIITFDYTESKVIKAEAYISYEALKKNAQTYSQTIEEETLRLLSHGLLHCMGYNDKINEQKELMRSKEEDCINLFHVKH